MATHRKVSKLFGALVIGGSMLLGCTVSADESKPSDETDPTTGPAPSETEPPSEITAFPEAPTQPESAELTYCQLEFSLNKYSRDGLPMSAQKTCLDDKTDAAISTIIEDARKEACESPFCGCWLG